MDQEPMDKSTEPLIDNDEVETFVTIAKLNSTGECMANGFSTEYDSEFPIGLERLVEKNEFQHAMTAINLTARDFMPCRLCRIVGKISCVITCGLSSYIFDPCTEELEENLEKIIIRINRRDIFMQHGIQWKVGKARCATWIELSQAEYNHMHPDSTTNL